MSSPTATFHDVFWGNVEGADTLTVEAVCYVFDKVPTRCVNVGDFTLTSADARRLAHVVLAAADWLDRARPVLRDASLGEVPK